ncbi:magnesium transporter MgtE N-terminal domain-containing protein [Actinoplanes sp. NPDC049316]|uniref:magnesium transporter MgtE N-terminal domain-containing protein n=1 Tax=Actinoplanes sp. NPDC049316 TaxID=3154727 RepID=UPI003420FBEB
MQVPSPEAVTTVADLAYELRLLKLHAGDPSVRDLSRRAARAGAVLPHSTAQDALGGKRGLPRLETVLALVRALDVGDAGPWRDAWVRAGQHHRGLTRRGPAATASVAPATPVRQGTRIAVVNAARGAALVETLPLGEVVTQLAEMSDEAAARRLEIALPARTAEALAEMDDRRAADILAAMRTDLAAAAVAVMRPSAAARLFAGMDASTRSEITRLLTTDQVAAIRAES